MTTTNLKIFNIKTIFGTEANIVAFCLGVGILLLIMGGLGWFHAVNQLKTEVRLRQTVASIVQLKAALAQDTTGCLQAVLANRSQATQLVISEYDLATLSVPENCLEAKQADERDVERAKLKIEQQKLLNVNQ